VKTVDGTRAWFSTDEGLAYFDGESWAVWRPALDTHALEMLVRDAQGEVSPVAVDTAPAHNYILESIFRPTTSGSQPPSASAMEFASRRKDNRNDNQEYTWTNRQHRACGQAGDLRAARAQ
jgi:hypothetical protein